LYSPARPYGGTLSARWCRSPSSSQQWTPRGCWQRRCNCTAPDKTNQPPQRLDGRINLPTKKDKKKRPSVCVSLIARRKCRFFLFWKWHFQKEKLQKTMKGSGDQGGQGTILGLAWGQGQVAVSGQGSGTLTYGGHPEHIRPGETWLRPNSPERRTAE